MTCDAGLAVLLVFTVWLVIPGAALMGMLVERRRQK